MWMDSSHECFMSRLMSVTIQGSITIGKTLILEVGIQMYVISAQD